MPIIRRGDRIVEAQDADGPLGAKREEFLGDPGGLTQFGAVIETLEPGARSALPHWHSDEDELVLVLDGAPTLIEGGVETVLAPGDVACFPAGLAVAHHLENRSDAPTRCLVFGTRAERDRIAYPEHDRICIRDRSAPDDLWTDLDGAPADSPYG